MKTLITISILLCMWTAPVTNSNGEMIYTATSVGCEYAPIGCEVVITKIITEHDLVIFAFLVDSEIIGWQECRVGDGDLVWVIYEGDTFIVFAFEFPDTIDKYAPADSWEFELVE